MSRSIQTILRLIGRFWKVFIVADGSDCKAQSLCDMIHRVHRRSVWETQQNEEIYVMVGYEYQYDISFGRRRVPVSWFAVRAQLILVADTVASTIGPIVKLSQQTTKNTNMMNDDCGLRLLLQ